MGLHNSVNLIRAGQDAPYGVGHRHLLDDVSLSQPLLTIDEEAFDAAVRVQYVDFVAHAVRLAGGVFLGHGVKREPTRILARCHKRTSSWCARTAAGSSARPTRKRPAGVTGASASTDA